MSWSASDLELNLMFGSWDIAVMECEFPCVNYTQCLGLCVPFNGM
jgi:hypothetical protein